MAVTEIVAAQILAYVASKDHRFARVNPDPRVSCAMWAGTLADGVGFEFARTVVNRHYAGERSDGSMVDIIRPEQINSRYVERSNMDRARERAAADKDAAIPMPDWVLDEMKRLGIARPINERQANGK